MTEQCHGRLTMPVEGGRILQKRDDAVDARQLNELVNRLVAQPCDDAAKREADTNFLSQPLAPPRFVMPQRAGLQPVPAEALVEHVGGECAAEQTVIDAAAG